MTIQTLNRIGFEQRDLPYRKLELRNPSYLRIYQDPHSYGWITGFETNEEKIYSGNWNCNHTSVKIDNPGKCLRILGKAKNAGHSCISYLRMEFENGTITAGQTTDFNHEFEIPKFNLYLSTITIYYGAVMGFITFEGNNMPYNSSIEPSILPKPENRQCTEIGKIEGNFIINCKKSNP